jgi:exodeoxyribonuclease V alpha subunit
VVELVQVVRQTGALQNNALKILNGVLEHKDDSGWQAKELARHPPDRTDQILQTFKTLIERETGAYSPEDIVILSPTNKDPNVGTTALNEAIKGYLFPGDNSQFPLGLKVINRKNSELQNSNGEVVQVMNGEIGYVDSLLPADGFDDKGDPLFDVVVKFEDGRFAIFPFGRNLATAYALTVHKAQGSEFPVVIFICDGFNLNQGMAYTALTRAQKGATVYWGSHWWRIKQPRVDRRSLFGYLSQNGIEVNNYA